jgi:hypothetical protein
MTTPKASGVRYPGELARRGKVQELTLLATLLSGAIPGTPEFSRLELETRFNHEWRLLESLCEHYKIEKQAEFGTRMALLALSLARDHVPAFDVHVAKRRGRPKKNVLASRLAFGSSLPFVGLGGGLLGSEAKKPRGRPKNPDRVPQLRRLLEWILKEIQEHGLRGRGSITTVLKDRISKYAIEHGHPQFRLIRRGLPILRKDVSEAKKLFPEIAAKFPR